VINIRKSHQYLAAVCLFLLPSLLAAATVENYNYPLTDRYVATVVGTPAADEADLPIRIPFKKRRISNFPDRTPPDVLWYGEELIYSEALQKKKAP
jgi:hypothetical protein